MSLAKGQRKGNNGNHGNHNSGRKPKAITVLKRQLAEEKADDAAYAFGLYVYVMRDDTADRKTRLECASVVMDRVLGKPRQAFTIGDLSNDEIARAIEPILAGFGVRLIPPPGGGLPG